LEGGSRVLFKYGLQHWRKSGNRRKRHLVQPVNRLFLLIISPLLFSPWPDFIRFVM